MFYRQQITRIPLPPCARSFIRSLVRSVAIFDILSHLMPSRTYCILFGGLAHALSAAIQGPTCMYMRAPTSAGKSASTHVCREMGERDEHKSRSSPYAAYGSDASRGTAIDGCLLQLTCERRAARTLRASRWRAIVECTRPVHTNPPFPPPDRLSPISVREGGNDIIPWWMLHPSGIAEYLARHGHVGETPSSSPEQLNAPRRTCESTSSVASHSSLPRWYYVVRRPYEKASTRERSAVDNMAYRWRFDESSRVDALWIRSECVKSILRESWLRTFCFITRNINYF